MVTLNDLYKEANELSKKGENEKAHELYEAIIREYPDTEEASYARVNLDIIKSKSLKAKGPTHNSAADYMVLIILSIAALMFFVMMFAKFTSF